VSSLQKGFWMKFWRNRVKVFLPTLYRNHAKRRPLPDSCQGSMTVEAAVLMPLFLFFFLNLMSGVEMLRLHGNIQYALWEYGKLISVSGYAYDHLSEGEMIVGPGGVIVADYGIAYALRKELGDSYMNTSPLKYGISGLNLLESDYITGDCVDIRLTYRVEPMFPGMSGFSFRMANRYYSRMWTGYEVFHIEEDAKPQEEMAYVTAYGEVYHVTLSCSHLQMIVREVTLQEAKVRKNQNGRRYTECLECKFEKGGKQDVLARDRLAGRNQIVYVTKWGDRYHYSSQCSGLKRTIQTVERRIAKEHYRPCSSCVGR